MLFLLTPYQGYTNYQSHFISYRTFYFISAGGSFPRHFHARTQSERNISAYLNYHQAEHWKHSHKFVFLNLFLDSMHQFHSSFAVKTNNVVSSNIKREVICNLIRNAKRLETLIMVNSSITIR